MSLVRIQPYLRVTANGKGHVVRAHTKHSPTSPKAKKVKKAPKKARKPLTRAMGHMMAHKKSKAMPMGYMHKKSKAPMAMGMYDPHAMGYHNGMY